MEPGDRGEILHYTKQKIPVWNGPFMFRLSIGLVTKREGDAMHCIAQEIRQMDRD